MSLLTDLNIDPEVYPHTAKLANAMETAIQQAGFDTVHAASERRGYLKDIATNMLNVVVEYEHGNVDPEDVELLGGPINDSEMALEQYCNVLQDCFEAIVFR